MDVHLGDLELGDKQTIIKIEKSFWVAASTRSKCRYFMMACSAALSSRQQNHDGGSGNSREASQASQEVLEGGGVICQGLLCKLQEQGRIAASRN